MFAATVVVRAGRRVYMREWDEALRTGHGPAEEKKVEGRRKQLQQTKRETQGSFSAPRRTIITHSDAFSA